MQISIVQRCCVTDPMKFVPVTIRSTILDRAISQLRNFLLSLEYIYIYIQVLYILRSMLLNASGVRFDEGIGPS